MKKNKFIKVGISYVVIFLIMLFLFSIAMIIAYALPNGKIQENIIESKDQLLKLNENPIFSGAYVEGGRLDGFTDLLIMNTAMNKGKEEGESIIVRAFENSRYSDENGNQSASLEATIDNPELYNNQEYSRYWHGIQTIIRPLLLFFNYEEIRFLFMIIMFLLLIVVTIYLYKNLSIWHAIGFTLSMLLVCFFVVPASIQFISIFAITFITIIVINILYERKKENLCSYLFFIVGGVTTFFDLLTVPLITLGIPLIVVLLLENKRGLTIKKAIIEIIKLSLLWCISYATIFFAKWVIASIVLHKDMITVAIENIIFRANGSDEYPATRLGAIKANLQYLYNKVLLYIGILLGIVWIIGLIRNRKNIRKCKCAIPLFIVSLYPYIWYCVFAGHSSIHSFFTYRIQAITIFGLLCIIIETTQKNKKNQKKIEENTIYKIDSKSHDKN